MDSRSSSYVVVHPASARPAVARGGTSGWVWATAGAWYVQASSFLLVGTAAGALPSARGLVGLEVVGADVYRPWGTFFVVLGLTSLLLAAFVVLGQGFAVRALATTGAVGTVGLALVGSWVTLVVPVAMLAALTIGLLTPALDHLEAPAGLRQR